MKMFESKEQEDSVMNWLLEEKQPSIRYQALVNLLDYGENDSEVLRAKRMITRRGWAAELLRKQKPGGYWEKSEPGEPTYETLKEWMNFTYYPKFHSTNWIALVLSEMGATKSHPGIRKVADVMFRYKLKTGMPINIFNEEVCIVGNMARMLTRFGYADDWRVRKLYARLLEDQKQDGGWNCYESRRGTLDSWEALAAFASLPESMKTQAVKDSIARGVEFYLQRNLFREGKGKYGPWFRFHYPNHYYYDILVGLDIVTGFGYAGDRRILPALEILTRKRRRDGRWNNDRNHPDVYAKYGKTKAVHTPLVIEREGQPSRWVTLRALNVLKRVNEAS